MVKFHKLIRNAKAGVSITIENEKYILEKGNCKLHIKKEDGSAIAYLKPLESLEPLVINTREQSHRDILDCFLK